MLDNLLTPTHILLLSIFSLLPVLLVVVPFWKIFTKAGFAGALSLLLLVPVVNVVMFYVLAFSPWRTIPPELN